MARDSVEGLAALGKALEEFRRAAREVSNEIVRGDQPPLKPRILPAEKPAAEHPPAEKPKAPKASGNEVAR